MLFPKPDREEVLEWIAFPFYKMIQYLIKSIIEIWKERRHDDGPLAKSIAIVGNTGSGKTLLYTILGASLENTSEGTSEQKYSSFTLGNRRVASGTDFGGGKEYVDDGQLASCVESKDLVIFLFDVAKFNEEKVYNEYRDLCFGRLSVIHNACKKHDRHHVVILGTHLGKSKEDKETSRKKILEIVKYKDYSDLFTEDKFFILELKNTRDALEAKRTVSNIIDTL